ncbi:DNA-binding protein [Nocardioides humi]|uniref:DNA binding domain-containing protein, excisionase family n=1 Tax=Nocardioides humi TaxID=449461 RepID=A0ABN2BLK5_9ACTN|nr:DNA-binding protein [Nocardioides humi]
MAEPATETLGRKVKLSAASELRGISTKTLRRRIADGSLTGYRLGSRIILVDLDELDALLSPIPSATKVG